MKKYTRRLQPLSWFNMASTLVFPTTPTSFPTGPKSYKLSGYAFTGSAIILTTSIGNNSNLVISPGMKYYTTKAITVTVAGPGPLLAPIQILFVSGPNNGVRTIPTPAGNSTYFISDMVLAQTTSPSGQNIQEILTISSGADIPGTATVTISIDDSYYVAYPFDGEQGPNAIVTSNGGGLYSSIGANTRWADVYGTQLLDTSLIDEDLALVGYIDNFLADEVSFKVIIELLENLQENGKYDMQVVDPDSTDYQAVYTGTNGMAVFISDLANMGLSAFLVNTGILNSTGSGPAVKKSLQIDVFDRLIEILTTITNLYHFGDTTVTESVELIIDPNTI